MAVLHWSEMVYILIAWYILLLAVVISLLQQFSMENLYIYAYNPVYVQTWNCQT